MANPTLATRCEATSDEPVVHMDEAARAAHQLQAHVMMAEHATAVGAREIRAALTEAGGDLRAVGQRFGLATNEILMILAYDITVTTTGEKSGRTASGVFEALALDKK